MYFGSVFIETENFWKVKSYSNFSEMHIFEYICSFFTEFILKINRQTQSLVLIYLVWKHDIKASNSNFSNSLYSFEVSFYFQKIANYSTNLNSIIESPIMEMGKFHYDIVTFVPKRNRGGNSTWHIRTILWLQEIYLSAKLSVTLIVYCVGWLVITMEYSS